MFVCGRDRVTRVASGLDRAIDVETDSLRDAMRSTSIKRGPFKCTRLMTPAVRPRRAEPLHGHDEFTNQTTNETKTTPAEVKTDC